MLYVPYWRFKGSVFLCNPHGITARVNDASLRATSHPFFPRNLGFRPQALKLKFARPEMEGKFFRPELPLKKLTDFVGNDPPSSARPSASEPAFRALIGETISLIYAPIFVDGSEFYDGVLGEPIARVPEHFLDDDLPFDPGPNWEVQFISTLCPHCGWDLAGERDSAVLLCRNCETAWEASPQALSPVNVETIPARGGGIHYLPFWKMKVNMVGIPLRSYEDLLTVANASILPKRAWKEEDACFWAPAFKVAPEVFLRLAQGLTLFRFEEEIERRLPQEALSPVTLPSSEAMESIKVTLAHMAVEKRFILSRLGEAVVRLLEHSLVYLPFTSDGIEFVQPQTRCCIQKSHLRFGRSL
jgi:hypothetical protein